MRSQGEHGWTANMGRESATCPLREQWKSTLMTPSCWSQEGEYVEVHKNDQSVNHLSSSKMRDKIWIRIPSIIK